MQEFYFIDPPHFHFPDFFNKLRAKILTRSIDSAVSSAGVPVPLTCGRVIFQQVRPLGRADRGEDSPFELAPGIKLPKLINRVM